MTRRTRLATGMVAIALLCACQIGSPPQVAGEAGGMLRGDVMLPSSQVLLSGSGGRAAGYRTQDAGALTEQPGASVRVRLLTRNGQAVGSGVEVRADGAGHFAFPQTVPDGVYLVDAQFGVASHVKTFVHLHPGQQVSTLINAASTMVASRLGRTKLTLRTLQQAQFDPLAAQARGLMLASDVPQLTTEDAIATGTDTFLDTHLVIKSGIDALLRQLAQEEGLAGDPTATLPIVVAPGSTPAPGASTDPTQPDPTQPDPTYTPRPWPDPGTTSFNGTTTMATMSLRSLDSTGAWVALESNDMLWVSCPASQSFTQFERSTDTWAERRTISNTLRDHFIPGQMAVEVPQTGRANLWIANQRSDGTKVAHYDDLGNFLGAVDVGPMPSSVVVDTMATRHVWFGVTGDTSGKLVVCDTQGSVVATGHVAPKPFRMVASHYDFISGPKDLVFVATPRALYRVQDAAIQPPNLVISEDSKNPLLFNGQSDSRLNNDLAAMTITSSKNGDIWLALQDSTRTTAYLCRVDPESMTVTDLSVPLSITAPVVSVVADATGRKWVVTENELYRFGDGAITKYGVPASVSQPRHMQGLFLGTDYALWGLLDQPNQLLKLAP